MMNMPNYDVRVTPIDDDTARVACACGAAWEVPDTVGVIDAALAHPGGYCELWARLTPEDTQAINQAAADVRSRFFHERFGEVQGD